MCTVRVLVGTSSDGNFSRESIHVTSNGSSASPRDGAADMPSAVQPKRRCRDIDALSQDRCAVLIDFQPHATGKLIYTSCENRLFRAGNA